MTEQQDIRELLINWYDGVVTMSSRVTSGNLSHNVTSLKGYLMRISVFIKKHYPEDQLALKHSDIFNNLAEKCDRITTGNVTHDIALIKGIGINYSILFKELIEYDNKGKN